MFTEKSSLKQKYRKTLVEKLEKNKNLNKLEFISLKKQYNQYTVN